MRVFLISFGVLALVMLGMAVGVILSNRRLKGSCGGLGSVMGEDCEFCDKKKNDECPNEKTSVR
jgi:hypothetical protein